MLGVNFWDEGGEERAHQGPKGSFLPVGLSYLRFSHFSPLVSADVAEDMIDAPFLNMMLDHGS